MHNSIGDVALTNISRETSCFHDFSVQYPKQKFSPFFNLGYVLSLLLNFGLFQPCISIKKVSYKKECIRTLAFVQLLAGSESKSVSVPTYIC